MRTKLLPLVAVLFAGACGNGDSVTGGAPVTETFTGTLSSMAADTHSVTMAGDGEIDVTLTALSPQSTITVGLGIGQSVSGVCQFATYVESARVGTLLPTALTAGTYCVAIYDVGNIQGSDSYTLTVTHP